MRSLLVALVLASSTLTSGLAVATPPPPAPPAVHPTPQAAPANATHSFASGSGSSVQPHAESNSRPPPATRQPPAIGWGHAEPEDVLWAKGKLAGSASPKQFLKEYAEKLRTDYHGDEVGMPGHWKVAASAARQMVAAEAPLQLRTVDFSGLPRSVRLGATQNPSALADAIETVKSVDPRVIRSNFNRLHSLGYAVPDSIEIAYDLVNDGIDPSSVASAVSKHREDQARVVQPPTNSRPVASLAAARPVSAASALAVELPSAVAAAPRAAVVPAPSDRQGLETVLHVADRAAGAPSVRSWDLRVDTAVRASLNASGNKLSAQALESLKGEVGTLVAPSTLDLIDKRLAGARLREAAGLDGQKLGLLRGGLLGHLGSLGSKLTVHDVAEVRRLYEERRGGLSPAAQKELEAGLAGFEEKARAAAK